MAYPILISDSTALSLTTVSSDMANDSRIGNKTWYLPPTWFLIKIIIKTNDIDFYIRPSPTVLSLPPIYSAMA